MAKKFEQAKNRTCKPAWNGNKYINATARHWNSDFITDDDAIMLLDKGFLNESDFKILPEAKSNFTEEELNCIVEFSEHLKEGKKEDEIIELYKGIEKIGEKKCTKKLLKQLIAEAEKTL